MSAAPDVLWLVGVEFTDEMPTAWDARNLKPLTVEPTGKPLSHRDGCRMAEWPDLADLCPCTADQRYPHRHPVEVAL